MELVRVELSLYQAIETRFKRSKMITLDMVDKIHSDAYKLRPYYYRFIEKYEKKIGLKCIYWSEETRKEMERQFQEKYYPGGVLKI